MRVKVNRTKAPMTRRILSQPALRAAVARAWRPRWLLVTGTDPGAEAGAGETATLATDVATGAITVQSDGARAVVRSFRRGVLDAWPIAY